MSLENFYLDYTQGNADQHAGLIWDRVKLLLDEGKKVGLIYSANNDQAVKLHASYHKRKLNGIISADASNQAQVFAALIRKISDKKCYDSTHILPVATSMHGANNSGKNAVADKIILRDLSEIKNHLDEGWHILVLTNNLRLQNLHHGQKYQIGGGSSKEWYRHNKLVPLFAYREALSQGQFVEYIIDAFFKIYNRECTDIEANELKRCLDEFVFSVQPHRPRAMRPLLAAFCNALNKPVESVRFSKSFNLRIICQNPTDKEFIITELSPYGAESLNKIREHIIHQERDFKILERDELTVSISAENVFDVLYEYCRMPLHEIINHYELNLMEACGYKCVQIIPQGLRIDYEFFSIEQCVEGNKFNRSYQAAEALKNFLTRQGSLKPSNVCYALTAMMELLRQEMLENRLVLVHAESLPSKLLYGPLLTVDNENYKENELVDCRRTAELLKYFIRGQEQAASPRKNAIDRDIAARIKKTIDYYYNSLLIDACTLYAQLTCDELLLRENGKQKALRRGRGDYTIPDRISWLNEKIKAHIINDIANEQDEQTRAFKVWLYLQVAVSAYLKANTFLFTVIVSVINSESDMKKLFSSDSLRLLKFLSDEMFPRNIVRITNQYIRQYGITFPQLGVFQGWRDVANELNRDAFAEERIRKNFTLLVDALRGADLSVTDTLLARQMRETAHDSSTAKNYSCTMPTTTGNFLSCLDSYSINAELLGIITEASKVLGLTVIKKAPMDLVISLLKLRADVFGESQELFKSIVNSKIINWSLLEGLLHYNLLKFNAWNLPNIYACIDKLPEIDKVTAEHLLSKHLVSQGPRRSVDLSSSGSLVDPMAVEHASSSTAVAAASASSIPPLLSASAFKPAALPSWRSASVIDRGSVSLTASSSASAVDAASASTSVDSISAPMAAAKAAVPTLARSMSAISHIDVENFHADGPHSFFRGSRDRSSRIALPCAVDAAAAASLAKNEKQIRDFIEAAIKGNIIMLQMLLDEGVDINGVVDREDIRATALHWAVIHSKTDAVAFLVDNQADITVEDNLNNTPLGLAFNLPDSNENKVTIINKLFDTPSARFAR